VDRGEALKTSAKKKKKYRPDAVYRRTPSGKYVDIGYQWTGFPADGIWLVQDGKRNMTCLIGLKEKVPIFALNYRQHQQGIVDSIQAREKEVNHGLSLYDISRLACDYFAQVAAKQILERK
jgi:hypothetical protein